MNEREIADFLGNADGERDPLQSLKQALKCGTECGSCVPELKRLVATTKAAA